MRIGLLITCLVDGMFPDVAADTVTVLQRVWMVRQQTVSEATET